MGTGAATSPGGYEFANMANDVLGLMDTLRLQRVHLLGFSMGGAIAQEFAIRHADRLDRLILFSTFCGGIWAEPASYSVFRRLLAVDNQSPEEAARQAWPVTYSPEYLATNADAVERQMRRELEHPTPMFVAQRQMEALRQFDSYRDLPKIRAPTLVATGADDVLVKPRNSQILASRIPNSRLELLADLESRDPVPQRGELRILQGISHSPAITRRDRALPPHAPARDAMTQSPPPSALISPGRCRGGALSTSLRQRASAAPRVPKTTILPPSSNRRPVDTECQPSPGTGSCGRMNARRPRPDAAQPVWRAAGRLPQVCRWPDVCHLPAGPRRTGRRRADR